ncbi:MAG: 3-phosphoshikimate 1-carboxyvinyltransferase [Chloroflexota bacterium]
MRVTLEASRVAGTVTAPPSKSYTIRGLMAAALARGDSRIINPLTADDTEASARVLQQIGAGLEMKDDFWRVSGGRLHPPDDDLFCGDSAATLRFMTAIAATLPGKSRLTAGPSLARRPVGPLVAALRQWGVAVTAEGDLPPVTVSGGPLQGGPAGLPGNISSQFVTALLLAAPFARETATIRLTTGLESRPYVMMTLECLEQFGVRVKASPDLREYRVAPQRYQPARYEVEGDWSSASYFLALGAVSGEVTVANLNPASRQGDRVLLDWLRRMGAPVTIGPDRVTVSPGPLRAITADLTDGIDLLPTVAVLAALAEGTSRLTGIGRARLKESDRVTAVKEGLQKMGIAVSEAPDGLSITGGRPRGANIDPRNDHRLAMAFSILGLASGGTTITGADCVAKTYPRFWETLQSIGGEVKTDAE